MENIDTLIKEAVKLQQQGDLAGAERLYRKIYSKDPKHFDSIFFLAGMHFERGEFEQAISLHKEAIEINPDDADIYNNMAVAYLSQQNYDAALTNFKHAVNLKPNYPDAYFNMAIALQQLGNKIEAESCYCRAIELKADFVEAYYNLGNIYFEQGELRKSAASFKRAADLRPDHFEACFSLGNALQELGAFDGAIEAYNRAANIIPNHEELFFNLALARQRAGNLNEAVLNYKKAISLKPDCAKYYYYLGNILLKQSKFEAAIRSFDLAIEYDPNYVDAYLNKGVCLFKIEKYSEAVVNYSRSIAINPNLPQVHYNLGIALFAQEKTHEAILCFKRSLELKPDYKDACLYLGNAHKSLLKMDKAIEYLSMAVKDEPGYDIARMNRALTLLLIGDYNKGWPEYEHRLLNKNYPRRAFPHPKWNGEPLNGKTILIHTEQGLGDTFQFARFLPYVKERGGRVVFECQKNLVDLMKRCSGIDEIIEYADDGAPAAVFDVHAPLLSLAGIFNITPDTVPNKTPYIYVDSDLKDELDSKIGHKESFRVGIVWSGNPKQPHNKHRACSLNDFAELGHIPGVIFFSLQKGEPALQAADPPKGLPIIDLDKDVDNFQETAAVISCLDLIISIDTSVAHLAGALGKPVWTLACYCPAWHLQLKRNDCVWYPTMRLFRQPSPHDWATVFKQAASELETAARKKQ